MSTKLDSVERKILKELNWQHKTKFKPEQFMEWSTSEVKAQEGEQVYRVDFYGCNVAIKL